MFGHRHRHGPHFARHGFGWGGRGFRGMDRSDRAERVLGQGDLRLVLLKLIGETPRHGYELIRAVEEASGGAYAPSPGVVYPTLTFLEETGLASAETTDGKKTYALTDAGRARLEQEAGAVEAVFERLKAVARAGRSGRAPQIVRALENLKTALRLKLGAGDLDTAQIVAVAAALDAAAQAIEAA